MYLTTLSLVFLLIAVGILIITLWTRYLEYKNLLIKKDLQEKKLMELRLEKEIYGISHKDSKLICNQLHTEVAGRLSVFRLALYRLQIQNPELANYVNFISDEMQFCENLIHEISHHFHSNIRSTILSSELLEDIKLSCKNLCQLTGVEFKFMKSPNTDWEKLDSSVRSRLNHIISEGLNNCIKHAQANRIIILLYKHAKELHLIIKDDGIGFQKPKSRSSLGLLLTERNIQSMNGQISISTVNGKGTTIHCRIPITT